MKKLLILLCLLVASRVEARTCAVANGDAQKVIDATTTFNNGTIGSATATFVAGDVGKRLFVVSGGGGAATTIVTPAVVTAQTAHTITTATLASATTSGSVLVWGTAGMAAAINTQVTACAAGTGTTFPSPTQSPYIGATGDSGTVTISGKYMVSGCIYNLDAGGTYTIPSLQGSGSGGTVLYLEPTMTACAGGPQLIYARGAEATFSGFTVDGNYIQYTSGGLVSVFNSQLMKFSDINIYNWGTSSLSSIAFSSTGNDQIYAERLRIQNSPTTSLATACQFGGSGEIHSTFCSNYWQNLTTAGNIVGPASIGLSWTGGGADECNDPYRHCITVQANTGIEFIGATLFGQIVVNAGAILTIENSNVGMFNTSDRVPGLWVLATGQVFSMHTRWRGQGGASSVINNGTFVDMLGNTFPSCLGAVCTERRPGQAIAGNQPITR